MWDGIESEEKIQAETPSLEFDVTVIRPPNKNRGKSAYIVNINGKVRHIPESVVMDYCGEGEEITSMFIAEWFCCETGLVT